MFLGVVLKEHQNDVDDFRVSLMSTHNEPTKPKQASKDGKKVGISITFN